MALPGNIAIDTDKIKKLIDNIDELRARVVEKYLK